MVPELLERDRVQNIDQKNRIRKYSLLHYFRGRAEAGHCGEPSVSAWFATGSEELGVWGLRRAETAWNTS